MLLNNGLKAMGVESRNVRTHVHTSHHQHATILEVLHGVLHPEAHNNGFKKKTHECRRASDSGRSEEGFIYGGNEPIKLSKIKDHGK